MPDLSPRFLTPLHTDNLPVGLLATTGHESAGGVQEEDGAKLPQSPTSTRILSPMTTQDPRSQTETQEPQPVQQVVLDNEQLAQFRLFQEFLQWHQRQQQQQQGASSQHEWDQEGAERPWQWRAAGDYTWPPSKPQQQPQQEEEPPKSAPGSTAFTPGMKMKLKLSDKVAVDSSGQFVFHLRACAVMEAILFIAFLCGAPVDGGKGFVSAAVPLLFAAALCWQASRKIKLYTEVLEAPDDPALRPGELPPPIKRADLRECTVLSVLLRVATLTVVSHVVACFVLVIVMYGSPLYLLKPRTAGSLAAVCIFTAIGDVYVSLLCWKVGNHLHLQRTMLRARFSATPTPHQEEGDLPAADPTLTKRTRKRSEEGRSDEHKWGKESDHVTFGREDKPSEAVTSDQVRRRELQVLLTNRRRKSRRQTCLQSLGIEVLSRKLSVVVHRCLLCYVRHRRS